jgi:cellulose synthase/poly-beta-1,6-N-acetylglucosamine synthase-like glycosyltransferase
MILLQIVTGLLFGLLFFWAAYYLLFALLGRLLPCRSYPQSGVYKRMRVLIPAYKEDAVILSTARQIVENPYPEKEIVVIGDSLQKKTLAELRQMPLRLVEVSFEKSTKARALNRALESLDEASDIAVVLDADNVMHRDFLFRINDAFVAGQQVVQGHRVAKNTDTPFAMLDACSEEINNHMFRKAHVASGLSAALIGSGMAFDYGLFKEVMQEVQAVGGFDKELELRLLRRGHHFAYAEEAFVYDEKVQSAEIFHHQRRRWLSAQWHYFRSHFTDALIALLRRGQLDYFNKALQNLQLPRLLLLGLSSLLLPLAWFVPLYPAKEAWLLLWLMTIGALLLSMPAWYLKKEFWRSLLHLPAAFFRMFLLLFRLRGANRTFIHTPHNRQ